MVLPTSGLRLLHVIDTAEDGRTPDRKASSGQVDDSSFRGMVGFEAVSPPSNGVFIRGSNTAVLSLRDVSVW